MAMSNTVKPPVGEPLIQQGTDLMKHYELLQKAIRYGDVDTAKEQVASLAKMKAKVQVQEDPNMQQKHGFNEDIRVKVYIEDKDMSGSFLMCDVHPSMKIGQLKKMMHVKHGFPIEIQKWIIGKKIVKDEDTLHKHHVKADMPLFLYLMSPKSVGLTKERYVERYGNTSRPGLQGAPFESGDYTSVGSTKSRSSSQSQTPSPRVTQQQPWLPGQQQRNLAEPSMRHDFGPILERPEEHANMDNMPMSMPSEMAPPPPVLPQQKTIAEVGWQCPKCTYVNEPTRPGCEMCSEDRPDDYQVPQQGNYRITDKEKRRLEREKEAETLAQQTEREQHAQQLDQYLTMANMGLISQDELPFHLVDDTLGTREQAVRIRDPTGGPQREVRDSDEDIESNLRLASLDDESVARALQEEEHRKAALLVAGSGQGTARVGGGERLVHIPTQESMGSVEQSDGDDNKTDSIV